MQCTDAVNRSGIAASKRPLVASNPNFVGYQVSIWWGQTEGALGDYSTLTSALNAIRSAAQADGKKIWLRLYERSFTGFTRPRPFPTYVSTNGWDYTSTDGGQNIWAPRIWEASPKSAFLNWCQAAATYCAANPEFVLISTEEYRVQGDWIQPGFTAAALDLLWRDVADRLNAYAGDCMVHINTGWSTVWPPDYTQDKPVLDQLALGTRKVVIGPTDLRKDGDYATLQTNFGSFMFNSPTASTRPGYQGVAAYAMQYEWPDYDSIESPAEHLRWAVDELGCHFIAWDPDPQPGSGMRWSWTDAIAAVNAAGGRAVTARPTNVDGGTPPVVPPPSWLPSYLAWDAITDPTTGALAFTAIGASAITVPVWVTPGTQSAAVGVAFAFTPTLASGSNTTTFSLVSGPAWASVSSSTGAITGTPTGSPTTATVVVRATNAAGSADVSVVIGVGAAVTAPSITTTALPNAEQNVAYLQALAYTGTGPITFALQAGTLPAGLTLATASGVISGTPTALGSSTFTVRATGPTGLTFDRALTIVVGAVGNVPAITSTSLADGTVGTAYARPIVVTGAQPITASITAGSLPPGLSLVSPVTKNKIRNPAGIGGTNGVIGSGGVLPTHWYYEANAGLSLTFTGGQAIGSIDAARFRLQGTPSPDYFVFRPDAVDAAHIVAPATPGQTWSGQVTIEPVSGTMPSAFYSVYIEEWNSSGGYLRGTRVGLFAGAPSGAITVSGAVTTTTSTAGVRLLLSIEGMSGAIDATFDIGGWQLELSAAPTYFADPRYAYIAGTPTVAGGYPVTVQAANSYGSTATQLSIRIAAAGAAAVVSPWTQWLKGR
jgi:hypothetical protein